MDHTIPLSNQLQARTLFSQSLIIYLNGFCCNFEDVESTTEPQVEELTKEFEAKIKILPRSARAVDFNFMMKEKVRYKNQFVLVIKVLGGKINPANLRMGVEATWSPCIVTEFMGVQNIVELVWAALKDKDQLAFVI